MLELLLFSGLFSGREKRFFISFLAVWSLFFFLSGRFFFSSGKKLYYCRRSFGAFFIFFTSSFVRARFPVFLAPFFCALAAVFNAFARVSALFIGLIILSV